MRSKEESHTDLGVIRIHRNVVASIASIAAIEIDGVKKTGVSHKNGLMELIGRKPAWQIKVFFENPEEVRIELPLVVKYGYNIPEVSNRVQESVRSAVEKMTNLNIKDININVCGIENE